MTSTRSYSDDEDDVWIPLVPDTSAASAASSSPIVSSKTTGVPSTTAGNTSSSTWNPESSTHTSGARDSSTSNPGATSASTATNIHEIQRKLEANVCLKKNLIDHPIDQFWRCFLVNLGRELWRLDLNIRCGLLLVLFAFFLNSFLLFTWFLWSPRLLILAILCIVPLVYLDPFDVTTQLRAVGKIILAPGQIVEAAEQLKPAQLRRLCLLLLLYPTALEIHTISFLTNVQVESSSTIFTVLFGASNLALMMYFLKFSHRNPRHCIHKGVMMLYGSALLITVVTTDLQRMPRVAGPFCSATGTLLITYRDNDMEWMSRTIRFALRLTLRDVLSSISEKVNEDEMLQLAMIRWIVDYWSYSPNTSRTPPRRTSSDDHDHSGTNPKQSDSSGFGPGPYTTTADANAPLRPSTSTTEADSPTEASNPAPPSYPHHHDVQWEELQSMLNMATDQMTDEVDQLQSTEPADRTQEDKFEPSASASPRGERPESFDDGNDSLRNLKAMLITLDVDERGRPAVMAYRKGVEGFPPTQKAAMFMSVVRRCPALLTLVLHYALGSPSLTMRVIVLLPFIILEYYRIEAWKKTCVRLADITTDAISQEPTTAQVQLSNVDAMTLLLSGDNDYSFRPPTLLLVWRNILSSVTALEVGLTATRCIQTTTVAVEFAGNIMSLAQLGYEISQFGLLHGVGVMAKEMIFMHTSEPSSQQDRAENMRYAGAVMSAIENGQFVLRNVESLLQDEHLSPVLSPLAGFLFAVSGHGWLWGKDAEPATSTDDEGQSTAATRQAEANSSNFTESEKASSVQSTPDFRQAEATSSEKGEGRTRSVRFSDVKENDVTHQADGSALSSVMELIAKAYEQGCIDDAEKNEFCEKLANLSAEERGNPAVIKGMSRSLVAALSTDSTQSGTDQHHGTQQEDGTHDVRKSPIADLIEIAYSRSLIVEGEKDAFAKQIADLNEDELQDPALVGGMMRALEALIQQDLDAGNAGPSIVSDETARPPSSPEIEPVRSCSSEQQNTPPSANAAAVSSVPGVRIPEHSSDDEGTDLAGTAEHSSDDKGVDDRAIQPALGDVLTERVVDDIQKESEDNGTDTLIKFGIAALGVVVGGVFLSLKGGNPNIDTSQERRTEKPKTNSTVEIEQLDDDGEDAKEERRIEEPKNTSSAQMEHLVDGGEDEWVSVQASSSDQ